LVGPNTTSTFNINIPATAGNMVTTGDTGTVTNTMLAGSIANAKLTNSNVTVGSTAIALGAAATTVAGLTLTSPTLTTPTLGTPASGTLTNCIGFPTSGLTGSISEANGGTGTSIGYNGFKNRIINGAMVIDQRNAGASAVTINSTANTYTLDRWTSSGQVTDGVFTVQQSTTVPTGFKNALVATVTTADASIGSTQSYLLTQFIEGLNTYDLAFGSASASTVTLSFWVRSSLTGAFGGTIQNSALDRSYPFSFTINSANTYEQKTVTIAGDTTGTWLTDTGRGLVVRFSLGVGSSYKTTAGAWAAGTYFAPTSSVDLIGTNGATFYITGVQLEKGSTATSFDYRPYGTELALCQRYFYKASNPTGASTSYVGLIGAISTTRCFGATVVLPVPMRLSPLGGMSITTSGTLLLYTVNLGSSYTITSIAPYAGDGATTTSIEINVASGLTAGTSYTFAILPSASVSYSAEF
jgi:hypothetical protein